MHSSMQFSGHLLRVEAQRGDGFPLAFMQNMTYQVVKISTPPLISRRSKQTDSYSSQQPVLSVWNSLFLSEQFWLDWKARLLSRP